MRLTLNKLSSLGQKNVPHEERDQNTRAFPLSESLSLRRKSFVCRERERVNFSLREWMDGWWDGWNGMDGLVNNNNM
jgi:hypothetical protein